MDKENSTIKAGDKRTRSVISSISDADTSVSEQKNIKQKKKKQKNKKSDTQDDSQDEQEINIASELHSINQKLSNMLTKDSSDLKELIKDVVLQLKEEMLGSLVLRIEKVESELFEKELENGKLAKEIEKLGKTINEQKNENERLQKQIKTQGETNETKMNELEQYSRRSNIKLEGIPDKENKTINETAEKVIQTLTKNIPDLNLTTNDIDITHRIGIFKKNNDRPIVLKMVSRMQRSYIMRHAKHLRKQSAPIYVHDHLTKLNAHVFACVRKKQTDIVTSAWSRDGVIYYRDVNEHIHKVSPEQFHYWLDLPWPTSR
ncbi:hypothetical protein DPMN_007396 [Dreissena polymorpha]|uniref:Uncharacterized protein n=1 Tax=Dreissena polymorpha TaxID=45954 RepID=A0A9D4RW02_DREPO|nr:hypothetical protein DPMN_007396 [Dreissena polymorpha]